MRKLIFLFLTFLFLGIVTGCGRELDFTSLQEAVATIESDGFLQPYIEEVLFEESSASNEMFKIVGRVDDSFDNLGEQRQFNYFKRMASLIREVFQDTNGRPYCHEDVRCSLMWLEFKTSKNTYRLDYQYDGEDEVFEVNRQEIKNLEIHEELYGENPFEKKDLAIDLESIEYVKANEQLVLKGSTNLADGAEITFITNHEEFSRSPLSAVYGLVEDGRFEVVFGEKVWNDVGREHIPNGDLTITASVELSNEPNSELYPTFDHFERQYNVSIGELEASSYSDRFSVNNIQLGSISITNGFSKQEIERKKHQHRISRYEGISFPHLDKNPDRYKDDLIKLTGQIVQIQEGNGSTIIRLAVTKTSYGYSNNDIIWVEYNDYTDFIEGDIIQVYGKVLGSHTYTSQAGWEITLPAVKADLFE